jgi:hypothetical protein
MSATSLFLKNAALIDLYIDAKLLGVLIAISKKGNVRTK